MLYALFIISSYFLDHVINTFLFRAKMDFYFFYFFLYLIGALKKYILYIAILYINEFSNYKNG